VNLPGVSHAVRRALKVARERELPRLAAMNFRRWARANGVRTTRQRTNAAKTAILWVDTFNDHFHPETSQAALRVLRSAGFDVAIPDQRLCCGRPLYDFGLLDRAKEYLRTIMSSLADAIDAGVPVVVLEPSCASVFRDELTNLFPNDDRASRLRKQTVLLSELLESAGTSYAPPKIAGRVLVHGHCHHKAIMKFDAEQSVLRKTGAEIDAPDAGCCGMAGAFGFEAANYAVSQAIGERRLLPAVRNTATDTVIVADGFSCREQIRQATGRRAVHLAEVLDRATQTR
jgi:Fe-S oxidoreductase